MNSLMRLRDEKVQGHELCRTGVNKSMALFVSARVAVEEGVPYTF